MMTTQVMVSRKDVMRVLGIGKDKLRTMIECGVITPVHHRIDEQGKPLDRAMFKKQDLDAVAGMEVKV